MVEHDIEAKDFKAHVIAEVVRVHIGDWGRQSGISCDDGFDQEVVDTLFELVHIMTFCLQSLVNWSNWPFVAHVHTL